jgi:hypothetical protein
MRCIADLVHHMGKLRTSKRYGSGGLRRLSAPGHSVTSQVAFFPLESSSLVTEWINEAEGENQ